MGIDVFRKAVKKTLKTLKNFVMSRFIQIHLLTAYPPSNLNRDDLGRPKTAIVGGKERLRISSQSLKRAWRTSDVFQQELKGHIGKRTKRIGRLVFEALEKKGVPKKMAEKWAKQIAGVFGKLDGEGLDTGQLVHLSPEEESAIYQLIDKLATTRENPSKEDLDLLREKIRAADIALFGRMLAEKPEYNVEAACQVAHAITVHKVLVEEDYYTAVDDLNKGEEDAGAGHIGETEFGSGVYYLYLCIDRDSLVSNLDGDEELANRTIAALMKSAATVAPTGKQNSFASRARAHYILCEKGDYQPRTLAAAFLKPVEDRQDGYLVEAIKALEQEKKRLDTAYGETPASAVMNAVAGTGTLQEIIDFATNH